jgi:subtilisin family serine protease
MAVPGRKAAVAVFVVLIAVFVVAPVAVFAAGTPVVGPGVEEALAASPAARVVILLDVDPALALQADRAPLRREVGRAQGRLLGVLKAADFTLRARPKHAPILAGEISRAGLARLRLLEGIVRIDLERSGSTMLAQSVPLVHADALHAIGLTGAGVVIGEVDTGVDTDHPDLAGAVVAEACTCRANGGCCPNGTNFQAGPGAARDDNGHGTMVAGIMTSDGHDAATGVAPGAQIVAVKVIDGAFTCCMADVITGLDWILDNRPDVAAINVSIGSNLTYPGECDGADALTSGLSFVINELHAMGIPVFAPSGNAGSSTMMSAPACVKAAIAVGATYDANIGPLVYNQICTDATTEADKPGCFSNSNAVTDLLAPGGAMTTSAMGGGVTTDVGTSFSVPMATACAALLAEADPGIGAGAIETTLEATGHPVFDPKSGITLPRIDCLAAVQARSCPDADGDDFWAAGPGCPGPPFSDCDDGDAGRFPGAAESCDGTDNDCDGAADEGFDGDGDAVAACFDNCPGDANAGQENRDADLQGDACDLDDGVIEVRLASNQQIRFQQESGFAAYDVYRGALRALHDTDRDGAAQDYGACFAENLAGPAFDDAANPPLGDGFLFLVTGRAADGAESDLGRASNGALRPNPHDCAGVFGAPPVIQGVDVASSEQVAVCDVTTSLLGRLCTLGAPGAQAAAPVQVHAGYTEVRVAGSVTDADDTPPAAPTVTVTLASPAVHVTLPAHDDGSAATFPEQQRSTEAGLDCTLDPQTCACSLKTYGLVSGDASAADTVFTRVIAVVPAALPAIAQDCIMEARRDLPASAAPGGPLAIQMTASDAQGHVATASAPSPVTPGSGSYACTGDPCGCCLLTAVDPVGQCAGLAGITSPDFPDGLCRAF